MKKLILAAALIASVATVKASSVTWGASAALDSTKITQGKMYLVGANDISAVNLAAFATMTSFSEASLAAAGFDRIYSSFDYSATKISVTGDKFNASTLGYPQGSVKMYAVLIETGDGADYLAHSGELTVTLNDATSPTQAKKTSSWTYVQKAEQKPEPTGAPEPTSGILLLLGVAGLALKRKVA